MSTENASHWMSMMDRAATHIAVVTHERPEDEQGVKAQIANALKYGSRRDAAEVIAEAAEWQFAHMMHMHEANHAVV